MATSEIVLEETPYLNLTTRGRRTGLPRSVELWFAFQDGKLFFLAHENSHWWKNVARIPRVEVEVGEILFEGNGSLAQEKLEHVFGLFRRKYGEDQVNRWYGGHRSNRRVVAVELGRVLGKRPSEKLRPIELAA
ncbi:MAG TPA: nitroreductase/quinone reductase family protein [Candidatus Bathyarchaeia archaeon]|nr:nitroreductase/quinone reductase family protein [Candidatus Bathyarchaeia archaeon]